MRHLLLLLTVAPLVSTSPLAAQSNVKRLAVFPEQPVDIKTWMKQNGWESKRHDPGNFKIGGGRLQLVSRKDSVMIGTRRGFPLDPRRFPKIRFTIRVDRNPVGTNPAIKSGDDSAFRLYIAFDRGGGLLSPPNSIAYSWTEKPQAAKISTSPHYKTVRNLYIGHGLTGPARKAGGKAEFITIERDLLADYHACFPKDSQPVPMLAGVMVKCDTNNTGTTAEAWLSKLELIGSNGNAR